MSRPASLLLLLPSLRISGGVAEALKLARELRQQGVEIHILSFWKHDYELDTSDFTVSYLIGVTPLRAEAIKQLPGMLLRFLRFARSWRRLQPAHSAFLLTHFTTFFFALMLPNIPRVCFNQDKEWLFVGEGWKREMVKRTILITSTRSLVITSNGFITAEFEKLGVRVFGEASIWADPRWLADRVDKQRNIDVAMLLRKSSFKRLDIHLAVLRWLRDVGVHVEVVTPEDSLVACATTLASRIWVRPTDAELKDLYSRTRVFALLSDVEGFGLPPLEAMGSGAIPLCRDSGGPRNYLNGSFAPLLVPKDEPIERIGKRILQLLKDPDRPSPEDVHDAFARGLKATQERRAETVQRLAALLLAI